MTAVQEQPGAEQVRYRDEEDRLRALEALYILDTPPEERFDRVTRLAQRLFGVQAALVTLLDRDRQWFKSAAGFGEQEVPRSVSFCNETIREPDCLVVEDLRADDRFRDNALVTGSPGVRFYAGQALRAPGGQPVGTFCLLGEQPRSFTESDRQTLRDLASYVQQELGQREEFSRAAQVQRGLFPRRLPVLPGYQIAGTCTPARAVGGDFFDWYELPGGIGLTLADVMGKGFAGAIIVASVRAVLRSSARQEDVAAALSASAQVLEGDLEETGTFVTLFHARLDPGTGTVSYADAGHGLTVVVRADGGTSRAASSGLPLGAIPGSTWEKAELRLHPGDCLVSFSDGLLDLFDGTLGSLQDVAGMVRACGSAQEVADAIRLLAGRGELADDVTALVVRRRPEEESQ